MSLESDKIELKINKLKTINIIENKWISIKFCPVTKKYVELEKVLEIIQNNEKETGFIHS